jgi:serine/threonine protein kinase
MVRSSIEDFNVLSRLGSGSYGTVFKVRRKNDDKVCVIKSVRIVELSLKEQQNAINEVTILSQLESPFVVQYLDSFISGKSLHMVMEYCNQGDLQGLIKKAKEKEEICLREDLTWNMAIQIILGTYEMRILAALSLSLSLSLSLFLSLSFPNVTVKVLVFVNLEV